MALPVVSRRGEKVPLPSSPSKVRKSIRGTKYPSDLALHCLPVTPSLQIQSPVVVLQIGDEEPPTSQSHSKQPSIVPDMML